MKKKIAYIISNINKSIAFEWINESLNKNKFQLIFILLNPSNSSLEDYLIKSNTKVYRVKYTGKKDLLPSLLSVIKILWKEKINIVHTHLFEACLVGLLAAKISGIKRRIYTRHNSTLFHVYYPDSVKYDLFINYLSTDIIAISESVKKVLLEMEPVPLRKIHLVHHGFKFENFHNIPDERIASLKKKYLSNHSDQLVIGVISRYIHWKGIQYIIPAFKRFLNDYPGSVLVLANAGGPHQEEIKKILSEIPSTNYVEIPFEEDLFALFKLFDFFVHVPIDDHSEAFGQVYVEALASKVPSVFTLSGVANELIRHKENALVVPYKNSESIYRALVDLYTDKTLQEKITIKGERDVLSFLPLNKMITSLENLYEK